VAWSSPFRRPELSRLTVSEPHADDLPGGRREFGASGACPSVTPRIWALLAERAGDNRQVEAIAASLPWPAEVKHLRWRAGLGARGPRFRATLDHLDPLAAGSLTPPWPDLVLACGRRTSMAALALRDRSGGRSRVVVVGRPRGRLDQWDLIVSFPPYRLPAAPNLVRLGLPPGHLDPVAVREAAAAWGGRLGGLARPWHVALLGGTTGPFRLDQESARRLVADAAEGAGTTFVLTSRRTPAGVAAALPAALPASARLYRWGDPEAAGAYLGVLARADRVFVTGDSVAMIVEAVRLGRPVTLLPPAPPGIRVRLRRLADRAGDADCAVGRFVRGRAGLCCWRDFGAFHAALVAKGLVTELGRPEAPRRPPEDWTPMLLARIGELVDPQFAG
jgi:mitochondrial fission protein ELM1